MSKKRYSQNSLLHEESVYIQNTHSLWGKFVYRLNKSSNVHMDIEVLYADYLRGEYICEDVKELTGTYFNHDSLINLIYDNFLIQARNEPNKKQMFQFFRTLEKDAHRENEINLIKEKNASIFKLANKKKQKKMHTFHACFKRKSALKGELILEDMEEVVPNHGYTLEKILSLLYGDFINLFRRGENSEAYILRILGYEDDDE